MERLQLRQDILKHIQDAAQLCGIKNGEIKNVQTNKKGEGYLGEIFFVSISDRISKKQLDLVIKVAFQDENVRELVPIRASFMNEIYAYTTVFPKFHDFLKSKGLDCDLYQFVPKCYRVSTEHQSEIVILENLRTIGFELFDKYSILDGEHIAAIFKTYGHFHGISLAYKDQHPDEFKEISDGLLNNLSTFLKSNPFRHWLTELTKIVDKCLINVQDDGLRESFQKYLTDLENVIQESLDSNCKNAVIVHGDCWSNNIMFKYNETSKKPIGVRLLDLQVMKYGNPVCDLSYCLYSGASKEIFDKLDDYLLIYHQALSDMIRKLGSNPEDLLTLDDLKNDWKQYAKFGLILSLLVIKMKLTEQDDVTDMADFAAMDQSKRTYCVKFDEETYRLKTLDVVRHMHDCGAL